MANYVKGKISVILRIPDEGIAQGSTSPPPPGTQYGKKAPEQLVEEIIREGASEEGYEVNQYGHTAVSIKTVILTYGG